MIALGWVKIAVKEIPQAVGTVHTTKPTYEEPKHTGALVDVLGVS